MKLKDEVTTIWSDGAVVREDRFGRVIARPSVPPLLPPEVEVFMDALHAWVPFKPIIDLDTEEIAL